MALFRRKNNQYMNNDSIRGKRSIFSSIVSDEVNYLIATEPLLISHSFRDFVQKGVYREIKDLERRGQLSPFNVGFLDDTIDNLASAELSNLSQQHIDRLRQITSNTISLEAYIYQLQKELEETETAIAELQGEIAEYEAEPKPSRRERRRQRRGGDPDAQL